MASGCLVTKATRHAICMCTIDGIRIFCLRLSMCQWDKVNAILQIDSVTEAIHLQKPVSFYVERKVRKFIAVFVTKPFVSVQ